ncbi:hypothetical protein KY084_08215 [Stakelama sp. CBK3Z-3]|uniref:Lipoprotein n=1 Tax=Stakelama flava TaxID=2860338 RepID=A0ABS6XLS2_9SPHN|nr:hypothetical protein [Stakelama flava]MBW4330859.1 hypothetical protein [Stakelama flava]
MKKTMFVLGGALLLGACGGGGTAGSAPSNNTAQTAACESKDNNPNYSGFSSADIDSLLSSRAETLSAAPDAPEWADQAKQFATTFLGKIGIAPDSLCKGDYKDIQTLMGAEMDLESRSPQDKPGTLTGDTLQNYVRTLYQTAGLTADRGYKKLDDQVDYTMKAVKRTRASWSN